MHNCRECHGRGAEKYLEGASLRVLIQRETTSPRLLQAAHNTIILGLSKIHRQAPIVSEEG